MIVITAFEALKSLVSNGLAPCHTLRTACEKREGTGERDERGCTLLTSRMGEKTMAKLLGLMRLESLC